MKQNQEVTIRHASEQDIPGILAVQKNFLLRRNEDKSVERRGFLVYPLKAEELRGIIKKDSIGLFVAVSSGKVVGYALSYDLEEWKKHKPHWYSEINVEPDVKAHLAHEKVLYFRHIARNEDFPTAGSKLEEQTYRFARERGFEAVVAEISERPYSNEISKRVHEGRGFKRIGKIEYEDGYTWGLYEKDLKSKGKNLEGVLSLISLIIGISFLSNNITGNVISSNSFNNSLSNLIGIVLFIIGLIGIFLWFKRW